MVRLAASQSWRRLGRCRMSVRGGGPGGVGVLARAWEKRRPRFPRPRTWIWGLGGGDWVVIVLWKYLWGCLRCLRCNWRGRRIVAMTSEKIGYKIQFRGCGCGCG